MKRICVFCGSSPGARQEYIDAARDMGRALARRNIGLVYGGGNVGLMGEIATAAEEAGGEVIGVIPKWLVDREVAYTALKDLRVVNSMHERKALMAGLSDGFVALPGGLGTIEEFFEAATWAQLGIHKKPCGLLNVCGYYDSLMTFLDHTTEEMFVRPENRSMIMIEEDPDRLIDMFEAYSPVTVDKAEWALRLTAKVKK
ncbi:TIGR00730 family Rossman fold protein [Methanocella sp. MCL-LM]|uniref:LOG family protein n=1 Tax=Methanocella sp. MCL-LM TaxID=3412035 RepID=UPI003C760F57